MNRNRLRDDFAHFMTTEEKTRGRRLEVRHHSPTQIQREGGNLLGPDGNQMEFQADSYTSNDDANAFMQGPGFEQNPIGVEFDPDDMLVRLRAGESEAALLLRTEHLPVSDLRGSLMN